MNMESEQGPEKDMPRIEATEPVPNRNSYFYEAYPNPYESTEPYNQGIPVLPPPPPKLKKQISWLGIVSLCIVGFLLIGSVIYVGLAGVPWQQSPSQTATSYHAATVVPTATTITTPTPTDTPTPIPTPTVHTPIMTGAKAPYPASEIVGYFFHYGLTPQTTHVDTNWSCCQYYPEGGAVYWSDLQTGITVDIATFASIDETQIDGKNLVDKGYSAYVENYCLLSYGGNLSDLQSYLDVMQQDCIYE